MLTQFVLFSLISSGGVFFAAFFHRRFEETLPLTCMGTVLVLFLFGVFGALGAGPVALLILSAGLFLASAVRVIVKRSIKPFLTDTFTPAFFGFVALFGLLTVLNYGKLASNWDEFSHWADIVKAMTTLNDFGTNPRAHSMFATYPPATALFEYLLQKINLLLQPGAAFSEWRLFFSYQILFLSLLFPFFSSLRFKRIVQAVLVAIAVCIAPLFFSSGIFTMLYIDPFLGVLSGTALAMIFAWPKKDWFYRVNVFFSTAVLVLSKESGTLFAVVIIAAFLIDEWFFRRESKMEQPTRHFKTPILLSILAVLSILLPKLLWSMVIKRGGITEAASVPISLNGLVQALLHHNPPYRLQVVYEFFGAFFTQGVSLGETGVQLFYPVLSVTLFTLLYALYRAHGGNEREDRFRKVFFWIMAGLLVFYIAGLCLIYMFQFSEFEALQLASFQRYLMVVYQSLWMICVLSTVLLLQKKPAYARRIVALLVCVIFLATPWKTAATFMGRLSVSASVEMREPYDKLSNKAMDLIGDQPASVYFISQETNGFNNLIMRYTLRPNAVNGGDWSLGEPFYEGDVWTTQGITPEEWITILCRSYQYVLLYQINDYFVETYGPLFAHPDQIAAQTLFRVNPETRLLEFCGDLS